MNDCGWPEPFTVFNPCIHDRCTDFIFRQDLISKIERWNSNKPSSVGNTVTDHIDLNSNLYQCLNDAA